MLHLITPLQMRFFLVTAWLMILLIFIADPVLLIINYGAFALLGILGAIFANATGAGGGVVFVPFFNQLSFDSNTTVATSFAIQCCGMTAGALTWWSFYRKHQSSNPEWRELTKALALTVPFSIIGILAAQWVQYSQGGVGEADQLHTAFGIFSILLAIAIFASVPLLKNHKFTNTLVSIDKIALPIASIIGGVITAYLSIGVGELIAVYLIMRRFNVTFAIAVAVMLSAFSVWASIGFHALVINSIYWPVVMFAGGGAIIGGILAKYLVLCFSAKNLKIFFASWVLLLGFSTLPF